MTVSQKNIEVWKSSLLSNKDKILLNIAAIKSIKHKKTNQIADEIHQKVFKELDCLDCANCCKSIPPIVNITDSKRISSFLNISLKDFQTKFLKVDEDGDSVFKSSPCVFLNKDNTCQIYEVRPIACREYPHTDHMQFTSNFRLHKQNIEYCPAVFHIVEKLAKIVNAE